MKTNPRHFVPIVMSLLAGVFGSLGAPVGTTFTYQGQIENNGSPVNVPYDFRVTLYTASTNGNPVGTPNPNELLNVPVKNGLFNLLLNFGDTGTYAHQARWLEIAVRPFGSATAYEVLTPRVELLPTVNAIQSLSALVAKAVDADGVDTVSIRDGTVTAAKIGGGEVVKSLNGARDDVTISPADGSVTVSRNGNDIRLAASGLGAGDGWRLDGNTLTGGEFIGSLNSQPLQFRVNNQPRLSIATSGNVGIGTANPEATFHVFGNAIIEREPYSTLTLNSFGNVDGSVLVGVRSRGTKAAPLAVQNGDLIAGLKLYAYDGDSFEDAGLFAGIVDGPVRNGVVPTEWAFYTKDLDGNSAARMVIHQNAAVDIGSELNFHPRDVAAARMGWIGYRLFGITRPYNQLTITNEAVGGLVLGANPALGDGVDIHGPLRVLGDAYIPQGRVGIGTATPMAPFHVRGDGPAIALEGDPVNRTDPSGQGRLDFYPRGVAEGRKGWIGYTLGASLQGHPEPNWLVLSNEAGGVRIHTTANGTVDIKGSISVSGNASIDGNAGVRVLTIWGGADIAEPFDCADSELIEPGSVVAIDPEHSGRLRMCNRANDRTVAGIVSGANGIRSGLMMKQEGSLADGALPVALTGRVYCKADAAYGAIEPGDLLTSSATPGHAMKVTDRTQAQGAILGKAMTRLSEGKGMVLVLVSLQ